ncbi:MAG TPA: hypothetical protein DDW67_06310 [Elusimicrobia bacterium]|jgi:hypothetical protein|nr:hypothetical protein [Elusimicrobiota bacterium]
MGKVVFSLAAVAASLLLLLASFHAASRYEGPAAVKFAALALQAVLAAAAFRRSWVPAFFIAGAFILTLFGYDMYRDVSLKSVSGRNRGTLGEARGRLQTYFAEHARYPDTPDLTGLELSLRQHGTGAAEADVTDLSSCAFRFSDTDLSRGPVVLRYSYLSPEEGHPYVHEHTADKAGYPGPVIFPGASISYSVELPGVGPLRSGEFTAPEPEGFEPDTGRLLYDPGSGALFINCTHTDKYKGVRWSGI